MQSWFDLVAAEKLVDLGIRKRDSFDSTSKLVARRFELGPANLADVELAKADAENARADLEQRRDDRDRTARILATLLGEYPDASRSAGDSWPSLDRSVAAGLPSDLLLKRPDIDAAYQRICAADARVKVAHADLFPSFSLTGTGGRTSNRLADLASSSVDAWSLIAGLSAPLFDAGQRRAELGAAGKRAEQAYQNWRATVLDAFREVEDALGSESYLRSQESARLAALTAARKAEAKTRRDYEAGVAEILTLLVAQRLVFNTEEQTINLHRTRLQNRVRLALALGKGT
jgi:NodT family efflux transporter outer membrane factor (OMF) lipoprotein